MQPDELPRPGHDERLLVCRRDAHPRVLTATVMTQPPGIARTG